MEVFPTTEELAQTAKNGDKIVLISEAVQNLPKKEYYPMGYKCFDEVIMGGLGGGDLVVISAPSGQGKTTFAQSISYYLNKSCFPCLWFSYEVDVQSLYNKFIEMGIDKHLLAYVPLKNTSGSIDWIETKIKEAYGKYQTKFIFIDHLGFLLPSISKYDQSVSQNYSVYLGQICRQIKQIAVKYDLIVFLIAHTTKVRDDKDVSLNDIGHSAGIIQEADLVFILERIRNKIKADDVFSNVTLVKLEKNRRTGKTPKVKMVLVNNLFTIYDDTSEPRPKFSSMLD